MSNQVVAIRANEKRVNLEVGYEWRATGMTKDGLLCATKALGLKKTQNRRQLQFYCMTEDQLEKVSKAVFLCTLSDEHHLRPLAVIDEADYDKAYDVVDAKTKTKTPGRFDFRVDGEHAMYKAWPARFGKEVVKSMSKIQDDPDKIRGLGELYEEIGTEFVKKEGTRTYYREVFQRQKRKG